MTGGHTHEGSERAGTEWANIPALVASAAKRFSDSEALVDDSVRMTFAELATAVREVASQLITCGIRPGDRLAIWAPNIHEWVVAALGILATGGILVPLNTRFKGDEVAFALAKARARVLFTVSEFLGTDYPLMLQQATGGPGKDGRPAADLPDLERLVLLRDGASKGLSAWPGHFGDLSTGFRTDADRRSAAARPTAARSTAIRPDDVSDIIFTSGTTGQPKGVMATHGQTLRVFRDWSDIVGLEEADRYLVVNPFFHTFGYKAGILACIMKGAVIVTQDRFDPDVLLRKVAEERISMLPGPPTLYQSILDHPDRKRYDLSSLRLAVTGAAAVPVELVRRMRQELTFETVLTAYGLTEATGTVTMCRRGDDPETIAHTSGKAIPGTEVRVVDSEGTELGRGQPGEIVVRGYNVMRGYLDDPDATAEAVDADGWLHTGDIGVMDDRGYVAVTDRKKDMFIVGGFNAYPAEIEGMLLRHPKIASAAVVGIPDQRMGEVGMAFVVPRAGEALMPDEVISWAREVMANYKVPRRVEIVDKLPLNASGKILKHELRLRAQGAETL